MAQKVKSNRTEIQTYEVCIFVKLNTSRALRKNIKRKNFSKSQYKR